MSVRVQCYSESGGCERPLGHPGLHTSGIDALMRTEWVDPATPARPYSVVPSYANKSIAIIKIAEVEEITVSFTMAPKRLQVLLALLAGLEEDSENEAQP